MSKCIIILSEKSSGSSACQNLLAKFANIRHVTKTRHFENETLYWTKAASILGLPQIKMIDNEVPIPRDRAKKDLITLLQDNLENFQPPANDRDLIFNGWQRLCEQYSPIFLEKSPHHLAQQSALRLIEECINRQDGVDFMLIGLVRNPMDTIYSQFERWRTRPEPLQYQWLTAYRNLLEMKERVGEKLVIVRYEDIVSSCESLRPVFDFCGVTVDKADRNYMHRKSLQKWKTDRLFGFSLSKEVKDLAREYGYADEELSSDKAYAFWPLYREFMRLTYKTRPVRKLLGATRS